MFNKKFLIDRYWWNSKDNKPHNSLIEGDITTTTNLGYFRLVDGKYKLTEEGIKSYNKMRKNNINSERLQDTEGDLIMPLWGN